MTRHNPIGSPCLVAPRSEVLSDVSTGVAFAVWGPESAGSRVSERRPAPCDGAACSGFRRQVDAHYPATDVQSFRQPGASSEAKDARKAASGARVHIHALLALPPPRHARWPTSRAFSRPRGVMSPSIRGLCILRRARAWRTGWHACRRQKGRQVERRPDVFKLQGVGGQDLEGGVNVWEVAHTGGRRNAA